MAKRTVARMHKRQAAITGAMCGFAALVAIYKQEWRWALLFAAALGAAGLWSRWYERSRQNKAGPDGVAPGDEELPPVTPKRFALLIVVMTATFASIPFRHGGGVWDWPEVLPAYLVTLVALTAMYLLRRRKDREQSLVEREDM